MQKCNLAGEECRQFCQLLTPKFPLVKLNLSFNPLRATGTRILAEMLQSNGSMVVRNSGSNESLSWQQRLQLVQSRDRYLALLQSHKKTRKGEQFESSVISGAKIHGAGSVESNDGLILGEKVSARLSTFKLLGQLQTVTISNVAMGDFGATSLASSLRYNGSLHTLNMASNDISSEGACEIVESLEYNR